MLVVMDMDVLVTQLKSELRTDTFSRTVLLCVISS